MGKSPFCVKSSLGEVEVTNFKRQAQLPSFLCKESFVSDEPCKTASLLLSGCVLSMFQQCLSKILLQLSELQLSTVFEKEFENTEPKYPMVAPCTPFHLINSYSNSLGTHITNTDIRNSQHLTCFLLYTYSHLHRQQPP